ncbi:Pumilio homolog 3 [Geodia barretti]|nr:Pumilio homolog 3 [Geodia barretti]
MMSLITGHIYEFALKHDTARIVQCCLKFGTPPHHTTIFTELKDHVVQLSKSKYAKFAVKAMMRLGTPEQRHQLISGLYGNVHRLARHKEAADVLETAYNDYANSSERANLVQEFYGRKFALFKSKEGEEKGLGEILGGGEVGERETVLEHMREALAKLLDKSVVRHSIVHRALLDFLTHCDHTSRSDMIDQLKELLVEMLHTRDGSRVTLLCLWHGTPKVRKAIVKSFKPYVRKICVEENGHVVMMGVFDTVDDTVLVRKHILSEMALGLGELCESPVGRRVVLYLLSPRNRRHFSSQFLRNVLEPGDGNKHTKKPREVRHRELLEGVAEPLLSLARERASDWARSKPHSPLLLQIAASLPGAVAHIGAPLVELLAADFDPSDHFVVHPCGHWVVKRLLTSEEIGGGGEGGNGEEGGEGEEGGGEERENEDEKRGGSGEKETGGDEIEKTRSFAEMILEGVSEDNIRAWTNTNRGAFIVCSLLSSKVNGVREKTKTILEPALKTIRTGTLEGQKALWKDINSNNNKTNH